MPRYFFDLQADPDEVGVELASVAASRRYALRYASELIRDLDVDPRGQEYWRMDVRRQDGPTLFSLVVELVPVNSRMPAVEDAWAGELRRAG